MGIRHRQKSNQQNLNPKAQPSLKELQKIWNEKLARSGFRDVEKNGKLINSSLNIFRNRFDPVKYEATIDYYSAASHLLYHYDWDQEKRPDITKEIWRLHSEGHPTMEIVKILKQQGRPAYKCLAFDTISRLKKFIIRNS